MNETYIEANESRVLYAYAVSLTPLGHEFKGYSCWFSKNDAGLLGKRILFKIDSKPLPVPEDDANTNANVEKNNKPL